MITTLQQDKLRGTNINGLDGSGSTNNALIGDFLYFCLLDVVFTVQLRGRWSMHMQKACFSPSAQKVESTC